MARRDGCAAREVTESDHDKKYARQGLHHNTIHRQAERHGAGRKRDRRGMPDRDRHQSLQRLRAIARTHAPGRRQTSSRWRGSAREGRRAPRPPAKARGLYGAFMRGRCDRRSIDISENGK